MSNLRQLAGNDLPTRRSGSRETSGSRTLTSSATGILVASCLTTSLGLLLAIQAVAAQPGPYLHAPKDGPSMKLPPWPPRARVLLYLSFDEGDGQVANSPGPWGDAVFGSSPETEPSDPQWTRGVRGGAVRFNGKDDYLTVPGVEQAQLAAFTFEAWVKPTGTSREMILDYGGTSWGFTFSKAWHGAYVVVGHKPKRSRIDTRQFAVSVDRWNHVAATFDGRDASVYVNGRLEARGDVPAPMGRGWPGWPLIIGKLRPNHYHMTGLLDELVVLDVARTEDEIFADIVSSMQPPAAPSSRQR